MISVLVFPLVVSFSLVALLVLFSQETLQLWVMVFFLEVLYWPSALLAWGSGDKGNLACHSYWVKQCLLQSSYGKTCRLSLWQGKYFPLAFMLPWVLQCFASTLTWYFLEGIHHPRRWRYLRLRRLDKNLERSDLTPRITRNFQSLCTVGLVCQQEDPLILFNFTLKMMREFGLYFIMTM